MTPTREDLSRIFSSLAQLLKGGVSLGDSFMLLAQDDKTYGEDFTRMSAMADEGADLPEVVRAAGIFPEYACSLLDVAKATGRYEEALERLSNHYKARARMLSALKSSLTYPLTLFCILLAVVLILLIWVLPMFNEVYESLGGGLHGFAGWLLGFGNGLRKALPYAFAAVALIAVLLSIPKIRERLVLALTKRFGDKGAYKSVNSAAFIEGISMGISSGMTEEEAVNLACVMGEGFRERCDLCREALKTEALEKALLAGGFISAKDAKQLEIGRKSGHIEESVKALAEDLQLESERALEKAAGIVEPIIVGISCLMIGGILLSVMLPLINIMNGIG